MQETKKIGEVTIYTKNSNISYFYLMPNIFRGLNTESL